MRGRCADHGVFADACSARGPESCATRIGRSDASAANRVRGGSNGSAAAEPPSFDRGLNNVVGKTVWGGATGEQKGDTPRPEIGPPRRRRVVTLSEAAVSQQ